MPASAETPFPDAAERSSLALQAHPFSSDTAEIDVLELPGYADAPFVLFLPAGCDRQNLRVSFPAASLTVNGIPLSSGKTTDVFAEDGVFTVTTPDGTYPLRVLGSDNLPSLYIETESGSLNDVHADKSHKEPGRLTVAENGAITMDRAELSYIKGRGNSSWRSNEKRSYNIKFREDTELLGMKAAKKWVLTSDNMDMTLMRNAIVYSAAQLTDLPYTVDFAFVDLYVNGGYRGNYLLCEKIEVGDNRIDIDDLDDANEAANPGVDLSATKRLQNDKKTPTRAWCDIPNEPDDITGGYLLEYEYSDALADERSGFMTESGLCLLLHSPKNATKGEVDYVADLYGELEEALLSENGTNSQGKHFSEYIDMDSFVDGLLLYDFTDNQDRGFTSWYIYLPQGSRQFIMGPIWDFDQSMENASLVPDSVNCLAEKLYEQNSHRSGDSQKSFVEMLLSHREFVDRMAERFSTLKATFSGQLNGTVSDLFAEIKSSAGMDSVRWGYSVGQKKDVELSDYVNKRMEVLSSVYAHLDEQIEEAYNAIGQSGGLAQEDHPTDRFPTVPAVFALIFAAAAAMIIITVARRRRKEKKH